MGGLFYVLWDAGRVPARVTVMNQAAAAIHDAVIATDGERAELGTLRSGESRALSIQPAGHVELTYRWGEEERRWRSTEPVGPGQPLVLYVTPAGRITPRSRLGTLAR